ncbi:hypothetical protein Osc1_01880 [Hominimerdicola sp. 21CYCFAH17_S]
MVKMADEQQFMKDLYKTIIKGSDLYNQDEPFSDITTADPEKIYNCVDGKIDNLSLWI